MVICHRCGKENQDHYKFCLGCGAELSSGPTTSPPTASSGTASQVSGMPASPGGGALPGVGQAPPPAARSPFAAPQSQASSQQPPMTSQGIADRPRTEAGPGSSGPRMCPGCGAQVEPKFKFCGECGHKMLAEEVTSKHNVEAMAEAAAPDAAAPAVPASLTLIKPDGNEGDTVPLKSGKNLVGRSSSPVFANDGYLSPEHAEITVNHGSAIVRDNNSLNGVFIKMAGEEQIQDSQIFRIGQELLRFETLQGPETTKDGTEIMGSPNPGYWGRITVIIGLDVDGASFPLLADSVTLGRERGDINFADDGYVSGLHAQVSRRGNSFYLGDLGSSNGTFIKLDSERTISGGSFVLLGQQLFRLNIN